ncbi:MAG: hypothetical protein IJG43_02800 [Acidaminococcaceae bacterium]|nr:hypothetical protein [Acidaminococcaceae bacterium]MBR6818742.1 hypothetical protein [Acidaminococcaceae bacterium]
MNLRPDYINAIVPFMDKPVRDPLALGNDNGINIVHIADFLLTDNW